MKHQYSTTADMKPVELGMNNQPCLLSKRSSNQSWRRGNGSIINGWGYIKSHSLEECMTHDITPLWGRCDRRPSPPWPSGIWATHSPSASVVHQTKTPQNNQKMKHLPPQQWKKNALKPNKKKHLPPLLTILFMFNVDHVFPGRKKPSLLARKAFAFERALCHNEVDRCLGSIFL